MDASLFFDVFSLPGLMYAIASGLTFGGGPLLYLTLKYPTKVPLPTAKLALLATLSTAAAFTLFFAGQLVQAVATDPLWPRAAARMALAEVFSVCIGLGLGATRSFAERRPDPGHDA